MANNRRLDLDIGGVVRIREETDPGTYEYFLIPGVLECLARLVRGHFGADGTGIVSRRDEHKEQEALDWLEAHRFFRHTGIRPANVQFCREREQKAAICKRNRTTHMVDNRVEVFRHMYSNSVVPHKYLFRPQECEFLHPCPVGRVDIVWDWYQATDRIVATL